jgi:hypothetical protein
VSAFDDLWKHFTPREREILLTATPDDMLAPSDDLYAKIPAALRAKFMAQVIKRIPAIPLPTDSNLETDPR